MLFSRLYLINAMLLPKKKYKVHNLPIQFCIQNDRSFLFRRSSFKNQENSISFRISHQPISLYFFIGNPLYVYREKPWLLLLKIYTFALRKTTLQATRPFFRVRKCFVCCIEREE